MSRRNRTQRGRSAPRSKANRRGDPVTWGDWLVGGVMLGAGGTITTAVPISTFAPNASLFDLSPGTPNHMTLVQEPIPTAVPGVSNVPQMGMVEIHQVMGSISFVPNNLVGPGRWRIAVALYVAEFNKTGTSWSVMDPLDPLQAGNDDYLFLRGFDLVTPVLTSAVLALPFEVPLALPAPEIIGGGEALVLTVSATLLAGSSSGIGCNPYVRSRITRSA